MSGSCTPSAPVPQRAQGGGRGGVAGGRGGGGRGGPGAAPGALSNLNVTHSLPPRRQHGSRTAAALGGSSSTSAWDIPVNYSFTMKGLSTRRASASTVAARGDDRTFRRRVGRGGARRSAGVSTDPFDWARRIVVQHLRAAFATPIRSARMAPDPAGVATRSPRLSAVRTARYRRRLHRPIWPRRPS